MDIILPFVILLGIRHEDFTIEIPDAKRRVASRKVWINEPAGIHLMKIFIERVDVACMEIRRVQEIVTVSDAERCAFINGAVNTVIRAVVDGNDRVRPIQRGVPT